MANTIFDLALTSLQEKGKADAQNLTVLSVSGEADGSYLIAHESRIPTWRQRAFNTEETPVGKPYNIFPVLPVSHKSQKRCYGNCGLRLPAHRRRKKRGWRL